MTDYFEHLRKDELDDLKRTFYSQAYETVEELQDQVPKLEADPGDLEIVKAIQRHFHTLKGDSGSLGFIQLSNLCHRIEDVLTSMREGVGRADPGAISLLLRSIDAVERILGLTESDKDAGDPVMLKMIDAFVGPGSGPRTFEQRDYSEYQTLQIEDALESGKRLYRAEIAIHPMCAEKSVAVFMLVQRIGSIGEIISSDPDISSDVLEKTEKVSVVLSSGMDPDEIREKLCIAGITQEVNILDLAFSGHVRPAPAESELLSKSCGDPESANYHCSAEKAEPKTAVYKSDMLRVEASKVDWIMNLVGELIIGRSIIEQIARDAQGADISSNNIAARLSSVNSSMERTVADLQKGMMKIRMVPINHVFRKFPKIVRELAGGSGKKVTFETYGQDRELDKGIVDALGEPLIHMIRNSIDHGIEEPEERIASGKTEEGTISLNAYHEAAQIVIEVADDGRGIDAVKLRKKAVDKGFISPQEAADLSEAEALNLIFLSGLSTSETLTDVSGRGIGMDAVKTAVEKIKGTIEVESSPGRGTKFIMRLPLTLAVIRALLVEVGERLYALPVSAVAEVTRVIMDDIITVDGKGTLMLRDRIISVIRMDELFGVEGGKNPRKFSLILGLGKKRIGLLVDKLIGQQELVSKAVECACAHSDLVAGASILGDGRIVLILDAAAIFKKAMEDERKKAVAA